MRRSVWCAVVILSACGGGEPGTMPVTAPGAITGTVEVAETVQVGAALSTDRPQKPEAENVGGVLEAPFVAGDVLFAADRSLDENALRRLATVDGVDSPEIVPVAGRWNLARYSKSGGFSDDETRALAAKLEKKSGVEAVELNFIARPALTPNDPLYRKQWYLQALNMPGAWDLTTGASGVVAVLDTGIASHPDLAGRLVRGFDFISDRSRSNDGDGRDSFPDDPGGDMPGGDSSWHGTRVAGLIASNTNDLHGAAGMNWKTSIQPVRVLGKNGGTIADIAAALEWASGGSVRGVSNDSTPARVLNLSLGAVMSKCPQVFQDVIDDALGRDALVVVAAGNEGQDVKLSTPANCRGVVSVASVNALRKLPAYSNRGSTVTLSSYGGDMTLDADGDGYPDGVLTPALTRSGQPGYEFVEGTSLAAPQVAAVASLMLDENPKLHATEVRDRMKKSAKPCLGSCGAGVVDAAAAVTAAKKPSTKKTPKLKVRDVSLAMASRGVLSIQNAGTTDEEIEIAAEPGSRVAVLGTSHLNLRAGETVSVDIAVDEEGLEPGAHRRQLSVATDALVVPVAVDFTVAGEGASPRIQIRLLEQRDGSWSMVNSTWTTVADGHFSLSNVAPGTYALAASLDDDHDGDAFGPADRASKPLTVHVGSGEVVGERLVIEAR